MCVPSAYFVRRMYATLRLYQNCIQLSKKAHLYINEHWNVKDEGQNGNWNDVEAHMFPPWSSCHMYSVLKYYIFLIQRLTVFCKLTLWGERMAKWRSNVKAMIINTDAHMVTWANASVHDLTILSVAIRKKMY